MFWQIYCPVFVALISAFMVTELLHFCLGYYLHKKQEKARREFEAKIASGEIDPMSMMFGGGGFGPPGMDFQLPTASGKADAPGISHGQYL